ncbi:unnamed protein product [Symbiodinium natans]|uniref:Uncharacterized protein n=1 Tax=Symbiodinium natans TaxID=878477 RepID=A0A812QHH0_9DINO|nr:unnamed protein product [Symbiodinium natans]
MHCWALEATRCRKRRESVLLHRPPLASGSESSPPVPSLLLFFFSSFSSSFFFFFFFSAGSPGPSPSVAVAFCSLAAFLRGSLCTPRHGAGQGLKKSGLTLKTWGLP